MLKISITCLILFNLYSSCYSFDEFEKINDEEKCSKSIYRDCNHDIIYTNDELKIAKEYLQTRFRRTGPKGLPCKELRVRKDIKCLSDGELKNFTDVFKTLLENGVVANFTRIHDTHWPAAHKFTEGLNWHRWFINEFEKEMVKINPSVSMPYWEYPIEFSAPEKSIVFDLFGRAGKKEHDYCVLDGPFAGITLKYPKDHCLRRQWNEDRTISVWEPIEWMTAINQMGTIPNFTFVLLDSIFKYSNTATLPNTLNDIISELLLLPTIPTNKAWSQFAALHAFVTHFKTHLNIGGPSGDLSYSWAPEDVLFWLFHEYQADYAVLKWQLTEDRFLAPQSYNLGLRLDQKTQKIFISNINDKMTYYEDVTLKESFEVGYGQLCYIHDQLIKPINQMMRNEPIVLPTAAQRLKQSLSPAIRTCHFPKFASIPERATFFDYLLPEVGNCNRNCIQMPLADRFTSTEIGRKQMDRFSIDANFNVTPIVLAAEDLYYKFMMDMKNDNYCSPYVSSR